MSYFTQMSIVVHVSVIHGSSGGIFVGRLWFWCFGGFLWFFCFVFCFKLIIVIIVYGVILEPSASVASDCWLPYGSENNIISFIDYIIQF